MTLPNHKPSEPLLRHPTCVPRLGILNDYLRIPFANGSSFASQFLYREFSRRGSDVTVIGPRDPVAIPTELPPRNIAFPSLPFRAVPGVHFPLPGRTDLRRLADADLSLVVAQTGSALMDAGVWLRRNRRVPLVCVNTVHLPSVYDVLLPQRFHQNRLADAVFLKRVVPWAEGQIANIYNSSDGLVVLSEGMRRHWEQRGVTVPISVISRSVDPAVFDQRPSEDPFPEWAERGGRILVLCRHTREKSLSRLLRIFARHILPKQSTASLTLVGDGPDHELFRREAEQLGIAGRCHWPGETALPDTPRWYRHADVFAYTSLSETYGQVVSEALWCGLPVVAFDDDKGVADQIHSGRDGYLVRPERSSAEEDFAAAALGLLQDPNKRAHFASQAQVFAQDRSDPRRCVERYEATFAAAQAHCRANLGHPGWWSKRMPLVRWACLHSMVAPLGRIRPVATVNRNNSKQPVWDRPEADASRPVTEAL